MDLFDKLVLPQSGDNLILLNYLQMIAVSILLVYAGILFSSSALSIYYNRVGRTKKSQKHLFLAKDMIDLIAKGKIFAFGMGVIPFLAVIMVYIQLLKGAGSPAIIYMIVSFVLFLISIAMIHFYQNASELHYIFDMMKDKMGNDEKDSKIKNFIAYQENNSNTGIRTGFWGVVLLGLTLFLLISAITLASDKSIWSSYKNPFKLLIYANGMIKFMHFITTSVALTSIAFLIKKFKWEDEPTFEDGTYIEFAKKFTLSSALIFAAFQPVFFLLNLLITPKATLNYEIFGLSLITLFMIFVLVHLLYDMIRRVHFRYISLAFYLLVGIAALVNIKEQTVFKSANAAQVVTLDAVFVKHQEELLAASGRAVTEVSGEDIYKVKCMACHQFETKLVGPPHKEVLPKYINNQAALIQFIMNPVKVNPAYPSMPSQGLKPKEAEAVAKYMIEHYGPKLK